MIDMNELNKYVKTFDGKCTDGIICKKESRGFIPVYHMDSQTGERRMGAVCGDCLLERQRLQKAENEKLKQEFEEFKKWKTSK